VWHHLSRHPADIQFKKDRTRMAKQAVATRTDLDPIDRLEEKVRMLVGIVTQLRADHAKAVEDNGRLARELDSVRERLAESELTGAELTALREERDLIRSRVAEMLDQLEEISGD
jgi:regulator of replication initiation timing